MTRAAIDQEAWSPWQPEELAGRLAGIGRPWCVVGGWALDLWHGRQTRAHEDIEFTILRADYPVFRAALPDLEPFAVRAGTLTALAAGEAPPHAVTQVWHRDRQAGRWRFDMMLEDGTDADWVYKRDPDLVLARENMVERDERGIPYLRPAAILLFKAKYRRDKDEEDFALALPALPDTERAWLGDQLERLHPGHGWLEKLRA